jgi:fluoride exporter
VGPAVLASLPPGEPRLAPPTVPTSGRDMLVGGSLSDRGQSAGDAINSDVDPPVRVRRLESPGPGWSVLLAVAAGGVIGSTARHALSLAFPHVPGVFGWTTFAINVSGCALIGVLMVLIEDLGSRRPLLRPFLGVGVLGGYTTFSAYALEANQAVAAGALGIGLLYVVATLSAALLAVWAAATTTRWAISSHRIERSRARRRRNRGAIASLERQSRRSRSATRTRTKGDEG